MRVKPFRGECLVEILEPETRTAGGIELPQRNLSAAEVEATHANPSKPPGLKARVVEIGPWPKLPCGLTQMPEFGLGATVVISPLAGEELSWQSNCRLKLIRQSDVQAILI